jgi:hypothetical protein
MEVFIEMGKLCAAALRAVLKAAIRLGHSGKLA